MIHLLITISIGTILKYYAVLCLVMTPLTLIFLIIVSRRTNWLERIDHFLDGLLDGGKKKDEKGKTAVNTPSVEFAKPDDTQLKEMSGVSSFEISVGESYICHLNFQNRGGSTSAMDWFNDNEFVGTVDSTGLFKAKKSGNANIFCVSRGHTYESGMQAYCIRVIPRSGQWYADKAIEQIEKKTQKADVLISNIRRKIIKDEPKTNIIAYSAIGKEEFNEMHCQFKGQQLARILYKIKYSDSTENNLLRHIEERFEQVELVKSNGFRIWIHQIIDNIHEEVDMYVFMKKTPQLIYVGIGTAWREFCEKEEFLDNIQLAIKLFHEMMEMKNCDLEIIAQKPTSDNNNNLESTDEIEKPDISTAYDESTDIYTGDNVPEENDPAMNDNTESGNDESNDQKGNEEDDDIDKFADFTEGENSDNQE